MKVHFCLFEVSQLNQDQRVGKKKIKYIDLILFSNKL